MILFTDNNLIYAWHDDNSLKQQEEYTSDSTVILAEHIVNMPEIPQDEYEYCYMWTGKDVEVKQLGKKTIPQPTHEEVTEAMNEAVVMSTGDNLINMDMLLDIHEKLNLIIEHLNLKK